MRTFGKRRSIPRALDYSHSAGILQCVAWFKGAASGAGYRLRVVLFAQGQSLTGIVIKT